MVIMVEGRGCGSNGGGDGTDGGEGVVVMKLP